MKKINRTPVHVIQLPTGNIYRINQNGMGVVRVIQTETWVENGIMQLTNKIVDIEVDEFDLRCDSVLEGNIIKGYTVDPDMPEEYILQNENGDPVLNKNGEIIYYILYYNDKNPYRPTGEVDEVLENYL